MNEIANVPIQPVQTRPLSQQNNQTSARGNNATQNNATQNVFNKAVNSQLAAVDDPSPPPQINGTLLQAFEWDQPGGGNHWDRLADEAQDWVDKGVTAFWLPPAYKATGALDVGYGAYDLWDLGEFDWNGKETKYGSKDEYLNAIDAIHEAGGQVYADIVINHKANGDQLASHKAIQVAGNDRNRPISGELDVQTYTNFTFPGRRNEETGELAYNDFEWEWYHFDGTDFAENVGKCDDCAFQFTGEGKGWDQDVSNENGNYDYLLQSDIDFEHPEVREHLKEWGSWYTDIAKLDGFRLDATKHISEGFYDEWLEHVRNDSGKELFTVSEYWDQDIGRLNDYVNRANDDPNDNLSAFDVPLHMNFQNASNSGGNYDMGSIYNNTLVSLQPTKAATFVDNHDSLEGRGLASQVQDWFKPMAYAMTLLREGGYPTVFMGDYEGVEGKVANHSYLLDKMMEARASHAYGTEHAYFDDQDVVGFTREGNAEHPDGLAVLMSDRDAGEKRMFVGTQHAGKQYEDVTNHVGETVFIDQDGFGNFKTAAGKASVWIEQGKFAQNDE